MSGQSHVQGKPSSIACCRVAHLWPLGGLPLGQGLEPKLRRGWSAVATGKGTWSGRVASPGEEKPSKHLLLRGGRGGPPLLLVPYGDWLVAERINISQGKNWGLLPAPGENLTERRRREKYERWARKEGFSERLLPWVVMRAALLKASGLPVTKEAVLEGLKQSQPHLFEEGP